MRKILSRAIDCGLLRNIDQQFAIFIEKLAIDTSFELLLAAALTSRATGQGHICLSLAEVAGRDVFPDHESVSIIAPKLLSWREVLLTSEIVGGPGEHKPLILDEENRLYLHRLFYDEQSIADILLRRSGEMVPVAEDRAWRLLDMLFPGAPGINLQKVAAAVALCKNLTIISGGPGTGKTFTVARILAALQDQSGLDLRIGLAAPTGKAAARLTESIRRAKADMPGRIISVLEAIPNKASTLHRLLGRVHGSTQFRYNGENSLPLDLLVVDEASMIDIPLMARLFEALSDRTRLILLGDRDQLASVEGGCLFADLCEGAVGTWDPEFAELLGRLTGFNVSVSKNTPLFNNNIILLEHSYRFREKSGIGALSSAVNVGNFKRVGEILSGGYTNLSFQSPCRNDLVEMIDSLVTVGFGPCFSAENPADALAYLEQFRILCALRAGSFGVSGLNGLVERALRRHGFISGEEQWYKGRPVMITSNNYSLQLFNGDLGIVWPDDHRNLRVWFTRGDGGLRSIALSRLPGHETAFATTIHKSQGSEFDAVLLVLPVRDSELLTRELVYTGITRAKKKLEIWAPEELLATVIKRKVKRHSGLAARIWRK